MSKTLNEEDLQAVRSLYLARIAGTPNPDDTVRENIVRGCVRDVVGFEPALNKILDESPPTPEEQKKATEKLNRELDKLPHRQLAAGK